MMFSRYRIVAVVTIVLILFVLFAIPPQAKARFVLIEPNKEFSPSAVTYTNKTFHFQDSDPYTYAYWTYDIGSTTNTQNSNWYVQQTDTSGEYAFFGFDEFVEHGIAHAEIWFRTNAFASGWCFIPLGYFYQKTNLESKTRWALALEWDASGVDLVYNTGNGDTPTSVDLNSTIPLTGNGYDIILSNLGDQTYVFIQDITSFGDPVIYDGYIETTGVYDARVLYAGFGQYSTGSGDVNGFRDDFAIVDTIFTYSGAGTGFSRIDAYLDEVFTQTLYDFDEGADPVLDIDETVTNITLLVDCWLNATTYGISTLIEGKNIIRQSITVTATNQTIVFSQTNLTYISGTDYGDNVFMYQYSVQLDFTPIYGNIYTVVLTYEIYREDYNIEKKMVFDGADPYSTYSYSDGTGSQGIAGGVYEMNTPVDGDTEIFGYDEFTTFPDIYCEVTFTPTDLTGAYRYMPIMYVYQKTDLEASTNWAVSLFWYSVGLRLYHNDAHGNTPTDAPLVGTAPIVNHEYEVILASYGNETWISVYDVTAAESVYSGNVTTVDYDPTVLYASFGQYSSGNGAMDGQWDDFALIEYLPNWPPVSVAEFFFPVGWDPTSQFGFDAFFIILGLIMIPTSTLYLAYGVKHDRSSDRLFYGIIIFLLGCGLFVGGILPP